MRFSIVAAVATLSSVVVAQGDILGSLPKCGQDCFGNNFQSCKQFDIQCICGNKALIAELSCCVSKNCNTADQNTIITLASGLCKAYGVDVSTAVTCAAGASSATGSASGSASSTGASGVTSAPARTSGSASPTAAGQSSTGSPGAAGPAATAGAGLGLAMGMAGLMAVL